MVRVRGPAVGASDESTFPRKTIRSEKTDGQLGHEQFRLRKAKVPGRVFHPMQHGCQGLPEGGGNTNSHPSFMHEITILNRPRESSDRLAHLSE